MLPSRWELRKLRSFSKFSCCPALINAPLSSDWDSANALSSSTIRYQNSTDGHSDGSHAAGGTPAHSNNTTILYLHALGSHRVKTGPVKCSLSSSADQHDIVLGEHY